MDIVKLVFRIGPIILEIFHHELRIRSNKIRLDRTQIVSDNRGRWIEAVWDVS